MNTTMLDLPSDPDAERFVIGGVFAGSRYNPECFQAVAETVSETMFSLERNRLLFAAMRTVYTRGLGITAESVMRELIKNGDQKRVGPFLDLALDCPELVNLGGYCQAVAECFRLRELYLKTTTVQSRILSRDKSEEIIADAQKSLGQIETSLATDDGLDPAEIIEKAGGLKQFLSPTVEHGVPTPWPRLNHLTNGLFPGQLFVLGAKPGIGKTSAACNLALHSMLNGRLVRIESYEMMPDELLRRMVCTHANVDSQDARAGRLHGDALKQYEFAGRELMEARKYLRISTKLRTTTGIAAYLRKQRAKNEPIKLLIVDYLQKMHAVGKFERRDLEVASIAVGLKDIAIDYELPVWALAQLNVDAREQFNHAPTMDDFRETKAIGMEADTALILRLNDAEQLYQGSRLVNMYAVKQRSGRTGKIPFYFHAKYCRYEEIPEELREVA